MLFRSEAMAKTERKTQDWIAGLYQLDLFSQEELAQFYDTVKYQGFNRDEVISELQLKIPDKKLVVQVIIACALRGPVKAYDCKLSNGRTIGEMGILRNTKGQKGLTCGRISAATADLAAFYLKRLVVPKRMNTSLPAWLQFPSAGSIKLPRIFREQHIEFSKEFSKRIGGEFNEQIYMQMEENAYYNETLKLFE